jgi:hypothetical protein
MKLVRITPFFFVLLMFSCTVQKRKHQDGFYVSWANKKTDQKNITSKTPVERKTAAISMATIPQEVSTEPVASASAGNRVISAEMITPRAAISFTDTECDLIVMRSGEEVRAKVLEVSSTVIKYKRCDLTDGPMYTINKSEVFMVKYPNGTKDMMPEPTTTRESPTYNSTNQAPVSKKDKKLEPFALIGFLAVIVGIFLPLGLGLLIVLAGIIMCIVGITKVANNPNKLKGKGLAITGLVIGLVIGGLALLALSLM